VTRLRIRIEFDGDHSLGPGKVQLLEAVEAHGSISAAARSMKMSYRHAWELLDDVNRCFREPVIETETGGRAGGGARLTAFGRTLIERYRQMQARAQEALSGDLEALTRSCNEASPPRNPPRRG
jgi:molybdate transport system regulatory protein